MGARALAATPTPDELTVRRFVRELTIACDEITAVPFDMDVRRALVELLVDGASEPDEAWARIQRRATRAEIVGR